MISTPFSLFFVHKSTSALSNSSSGGAFYALASETIRNGGIVFGAAIDEKGTVFHKGVTTIDDLKDLMGSKYVMSKIGSTFSEAKEALIRGQQVLFSGTPCQINSLRRFLDGMSHENLLLVDIICHGCPKPEYWRKYLESLPAKPPLSVSFRDKSISWERFSLKVNSIKDELALTTFGRLFLQNYTLLDSCYRCKCKGENREADVTLGDAWGYRDISLEGADSRGTSLVLIRHKMDKVLPTLEQSGKVTQVFYWEAIAHNTAYSSSVIAPKDREAALENAFSPSKANESAKEKRVFLRKLKSILWKAIYCKYNKERARELTIPIKNDIGVITLTGYSNFGNKLQNYALLTILKGLGYHPIDIYRSCEFPLPFWHRRLLYFRNREKYYEQRRVWLFYKTCKQYEGQLFHYRPTIECVGQIQKLDTVVFGGDQIWNPVNIRNLAYHLGGFPCDGPMPPFISYSASVCSDQFDTKIADYFRHYLTRFDGVSVREESAKKAINNLGISAETHLDPVFLLAPKQWNEAIARYAKKGLSTKKPYVVKYLLSPSNEAQNCINQLCFENPFQLIDVLSTKGGQFIGPFEFVRLIRDAEVVVTDSFHALAFSIVFGKKVILWNRANGADSGMSLRLYDLLRLFGLSEEIGTGRIIDCRDVLQNQSYRREIEKARTYLQTTLRKAKNSSVSAI